MSGSQCCENPPAPSSGGESGDLHQIASLNSYVSGNPDSKIAVLLVSDVFGYGAPKLRKLADKVASAGYYVGPAVDFAKPVIQALKEKGITKIGAAGFCWGAKVVVDLAKDTDLQVAALLHPSFVTLDDIKGVKVPIAILGAEIDQRSPPEVVKQFEEALEAKPEVDQFVKIYPGVTHGWTVRYKDEDEVAVKCALEAHQDLLDWFGKCLKH
ncbi:hypothetical protein OSB04_031138 [Centaurea solstitialis]|uniref:Dienelactone hydrolase domain-containing protein n=1 Tax=Centaurea solstitialis TaxID=347529 RepID=A0AA38SLL2_9ASTR|nr:hypothetical protein OSB04_031138 [Centaurea solstitialis]